MKKKRCKVQTKGNISSKVRCQRRRNHEGRHDFEIK
jgi:hypothetical protein